jgi:lipopolysaccharide transport system permease protein
VAAIHPISWRQIRVLTAASIKSRYRNTYAGLLWVILSPLLMFSVQGYVFKRVLGIHFENYPVFLLTGLMPWIFLTQSASMSTGLMVSNSRLFKSFPIHPMASLMAILIDNLINFTMTFTIILTGLFIFGGSVQWMHFALMPIPFFFMFIAVVGLCWFLATMQVFFHDVKFITDFVLSVMFYLTPIFYPAKFVPPDFLWIVNWNPIAILLAPIQALSLDVLPADYGWQLAQSALVAASVSILSSIFWLKKKNQMYFRL